MLQVQLDHLQSKAFELLTPGTVCTLPFGRGAGKTFFGRVCIHTFALRDPGTHVGLLMPSLKQARAVFWPGLLDDFARMGIKPNLTTLEATYPNGSRLTTWGAENAQSVRGQRFDALVQDEADDIEPDIEAAVVEPTFSKSGSRALWLKTGTPRRGMAGLLYRDFARARDGVEVEGRRYVGFRVSSEESPQVDQAWLRGIKATIDPQVYAREYSCDFSASEALVYDAFDPKFHVRAPHAATKWSMVLVGVDHGWEDPGVMLVVGVQGTGRDARCHIIREVYRQHEPELWWTEQARQIHREFPRAAWYADPSRPDRIEALRRGAGMAIFGANNRVLDGISTVANKLFVRRPEHGDAFANLYVDPSCVNTVREFGLYRRKRDPQNRERVTEHIDTRNDHALDALRYALHSYFSAPGARGDLSAI